MKKTVSLMLILVLAFSMFGCAKKTRPEIEIKRDSVTAIDFTRTEFSTQTPDGRDYYLKSVTDPKDIDALVDWLQSLDLTEHEAIEIPSEQVEYFIVLNGVKDHSVVFFGGYVVYDNTAYTYNTASQRNSVAECYNMLNYEEQSTVLDLLS